MKNVVNEVKELNLKTIEWASFVLLSNGSELCLSFYKDNEDFDNNFEKDWKGIEYDGGYGSQELEATIVFTDGTWYSRGEYDGSEWWEYNCTPERPTFNKDF